MTLYAFFIQILVPSMKNLFSTVSGNGREMLNVLHATFLVYNSGLSKITTAIAVDLFRLLNDRITSQVCAYT